MDLSYFGSILLKVSFLKKKFSEASSEVFFMGSVSITLLGFIIST